MQRYFSIMLVVLAMFALPLTSFAAKTHKLKKSETLSSLAKKYQVSVAELKAVNNIAGNQVKRGTVLIIPVHAKAAEDKGVSGAVTYKAKKSEPLSTVSRRTGVSVFELKRLNNLTKNRVKAGQILVLRDASVVDDEAPVSAKVVTSRKLHLRHPDLLNENEYATTLADLVEPEQVQDVDLQKNAEFNPENVKQLKRSAFGFLGTRYRFGGTTRRGLDCSSFVQQVFKELDVSLPRTAREQFEVGNRVASADLQKGDLVFFRTYASFPSHVGIYLGNNRMIHASSRDRRVVISTLNTSYYRSRYIGAKRIEKINPSIFNLEELILDAEEENIGAEEQNDNLGISSLSSSN
jgi:peptidoglycan DL-endopeptidase LytE